MARYLLKYSSTSKTDTYVCSEFDIHLNFKIMKSVSYDTLPQAIEEIFARLDRIEAALSSPEEKDPEQDKMLMDEAIEFLKESGRPTSKSTVYKESSLGWIPCERVGKRLVFSRERMRGWIAEGMPRQILQDATDRLSVRMNGATKEGRN